MSSRRPNRLAAMVREPVTVAIVVAVLITGGLAFAVLAVWSGGSDGNTQLAAPALDQAEPTPTPRTVHWPSATAPASPPPSPARRATPAVAAVPQISAANSPTTVPRPTRTPEPEPTIAPAPEPPPSSTPAPTVVPTVAPTAAPTATPAAEPAFMATNAESFRQMANGRWTVVGNRLVLDPPQATSEPWILAPYQAPTGDFAVEAEIRIDGLGQGYCNQSFGVVAGSEQRGRFWGGGIIYGCGSGTPLARISDISTWTDGYDRDRALDSEPFPLDQDWHLLRLEVRGNEFRLLIDGAEVLTATDDQLRTDLRSGQAGLWTQGVGLTVRHFAIFAL